MYINPHSLRSHCTRIGRCQTGLDPDSSQSTSGGGFDPDWSESSLIIISQALTRLTLSWAGVIIARKSPGHTFLASFNRNTARKRYPYCQGYNGFWRVVHPVEYAQIRHGRHSVISSCRTTVVHERGSLAIIDHFPPGPAFTWSWQAIGNSSYRHSRTTWCVLDIYGYIIDTIHPLGDLLE